MLKSKILFFICFFFNISVCYSSTVLSLDDVPLESLLQHIKSLLTLDIPESSETDEACSSKTPAVTLCEVDVARAQDISKAINEVESLYKSGKYGNLKSLSALELKAQESIYAFSMIMKYYSYQEKLKRLPPFSSPELQSCISTFISFLGDNVMALSEFKEIENPFINISLALFHQIRGDYKLAQQFAQAAANQNCTEGYNIIGNFYKKIDVPQSVRAYLKAAQYGNSKGIYKLAKLYSSSDGNVSKALYKHAAALGNAKSYFALGRLYEKQHQRSQSIGYMSTLIGIDPYLYIHLEQKEGLWNTAFYVAEKLLDKKPRFFPSFLKGIYEHKPSKRKKIAHIFGIGHAFGKYGFLLSRKDAYHWLDVSFTEYGNLQDGYLLCCMIAADSQHNEFNDRAITICRHLLDSPEFLKKYGTLLPILLARLLVAKTENQENPRPLEEASYWLLKALNEFERDSSDRRRIVWQIPKTHIRGRFSDVESAHLDVIDGASSHLTRQQASYALGFHHLSGGFEGLLSLAKARQYFFRAGNFLPATTYFYVSVIGHHLSLQNLMHSPDYTTEDIRRIKAIETYRVVAGLLDRYTDLGESERNLLKRKVRELSKTNLAEAVYALALWFNQGMHGLTPSIEHEIYWLKYAASNGDEIAKGVLNSRYPLVLPLTEAKEVALHYARTHSEDNPDFSFLGGGWAGVMAAISLAKARADKKLPTGQIRVIDKNLYLFLEASGLISREHLGGEYPKEEDHMTGKQCLYSTAIRRQMYGTKRMLTDIMRNVFLLARGSQELGSGDAALSKEELFAHQAFLEAHYKEYLKEFEALGLKGEGQLFGSTPFFEELSDADLERFGLSPHFVAGVSTAERGFNPIAVGTILEHLLRQYNIEVITGYEVTNIKALPRGGFQIEGRGQKPIYSKYVVNAMGNHNLRLRWLLKNSLPSTALTVPGFPVVSSPKRVFLRCLALVDISNCTLPEDRSFFGLLGESGGMLSCFNDWIASLFVPKEGLSYHGEYSLDESAVNMLPRAARDRLAQLERDKMDIAARILVDIQTKYPFLKNAKPKGLSIQTTVSDNDEIFKRNHSNARWLEGAEGCLESYLTKGSFGPFQALQSLARFVIDRPGGLESHFGDEEMRFLKSLIHPDMFQEGTVEKVILPDSFKIITDDSFMADAEFHAAMRRYAFVRGFDFAIFEKTREAAAVGADPIEQLRLMGEEERMESLDLGSHILNESMASTLFPLLERGDIALSNVKLGPLDEDINDDAEDRLGEEILVRLLRNDHLRNLTLKGWNLTFPPRYNPLAAFLPRLQELHLNGVTLTVKSVQAIFENSSHSLSALKRLSIISSNPKRSVLQKLILGLQNCRSLEFLDLSRNEIGKESPDETSRDLGYLIKEVHSLRSLLLHNNRLFEGINLAPFNPTSLPLDLEANPFLLAITEHSRLKNVSVTDNGPVSMLVQDRLDSYFLKKEFLH
ncbi:MAG: hypothetical protein K2W94_00510 [Alphaproteobacteria bacterium]|nr:hypothetical protein [Alphaproteobacteria bacterium]